MNKIIRKSVEIQGKEIIFETGKFAEQANGAVTVQMGETVVLATVVSGNLRPDIDYFPLFVEYQEKLYAGGVIKGSRWVKREGRPSDEAVLAARLVDRSIRPLFPKEYRNEVQVVITVFSVDQENDADVLGILAASAALHISDIPWNGPVAGMRIGLLNNKFIINPKNGEREKSSLDLIFSASREEIAMIEAGAWQVKEEDIVEGLKTGIEEERKIIEVIEELRKEAGKEKTQNSLFLTKQEKLKTKNELLGIRDKIKNEIKQFIDKILADKVSLEALKEIKKHLEEEYGEEEKQAIEKIVDEEFKEQVREMMLGKRKRIDGRGLDEIRPLKMAVEVLPRTHGSAIFQRGNTQVLTITTLGAPSLEQWIEGPEGQETKRYMHHYYMPPYSVGEVGRFAWPSRREVGHGALAERALMPLIPSEEEFPYTIRVVSEIMSSNGSTSMASVCGSSLSLMDAGVPIKKPVAGIAMGLITKSKIKNQKSKIEDFVILTDIAGIEDYLGDMDFKVAGTEDGVTALQMDVKISGAGLEILAEGLFQAKKARIFILAEMKKIMPAPRSSVSKYAPKIEVLHIDVEKIGDIIGPGGRIIKKIIAETGAAVDVEDDGTVSISGIEKEGVNKALEWIKGLTREVKIGEITEGKVTRIEPYGIFVELFPGREGLVHVSQMAQGFVSDPSSLVSLGQKIKVKTLNVDDAGRVKLSMILEGVKRERPVRKFPFQKQRGPQERRERHFYGKTTFRRSR